MNTSLHIARRYLFSKKSTNAINIISGISMLGVFIGSAALIIVLSVFNGFEHLIVSMLNTITPELMIEPAAGKTFDPNLTQLQQFKKDGRVISFTEILQDNAVLSYGNKQHIATVKGVGADFLKNQKLDSTIVIGRFALVRGIDTFAVIGATIQRHLAINTDDVFRQLNIYAPKRGKMSSANPADEFVVVSKPVSGVYEIQKEYDNNVIVPINVTRKLFGESTNVSGVEINLKSGTNINAFKQELQNILGKQFVVKNRIQQNQLVYKILNTERLAIFVILTFILMVAIFNIIGSLTMLVIDKKKDIAILSGLGADKTLIRRIFFYEGMMISIIGCVMGLFISLLFCLLQIRFGFIKMGSKQAIMEAYPMHLDWKDFVLVFFTVTLIAWFASMISSRLSVKGLGNLREDL